MNSICLRDPLHLHSRDTGAEPHFTCFFRIPYFLGLFVFLVCYLRENTSKLR